EVTAAKIAAAKIAAAKIATAETAKTAEILGVRQDGHAEQPSQGEHGQKARREYAMSFAHDCTSKKMPKAERRYTTRWFHPLSSICLRGLGVGLPSPTLIKQPGALQVSRHRRTGTRAGAGRRTRGRRKLARLFLRILSGPSAGRSAPLLPPFRANRRQIPCFRFLFLWRPPPRECTTSKGFARSARPLSLAPTAPDPLQLRETHAWNPF